MMDKEITRRELLKKAAAAGILLAAGAELAGGKVVQAGTGFREPLPHIAVKGLIRPPGALPENEFRAKCISCGVCVNVCHTMKFDALAIVGLEDLNNFGTPYLKDMRDFPCALCMECPKHCPTGALQRVEKEDVRMGMALIDFSLCFGWNGDVCLSCSKACPLGAKVFDFYYSDWGNQPVINEKCVGCGLCVRYCPLGGSAIKVVTRTQYSSVKEEYYNEFQRVLNLNHFDRYNEEYNKNMPEIMRRGRIIERDFR
jgi:MauM/NapG family ferredoxin protein